MIRKLIHLTVTKPKISIVVGLLSQFMHKLKDVNWKATMSIVLNIGPILHFLIQMQRYKQCPSVEHFLRNSNAIFGPNRYCNRNIICKIAKEIIQIR